MRHRLEGAFADAVARASHDPFVPYENATGIVNLAECSTSNGGGMGAGAGGGWDDPPEGTVDEVVIATVRELEGLFGQGGVEATAFNPADGGSLGPGFVRLSLSQFQDDPHSWASEAELWESMVETYGVLLVPGALVEPAGDPAWDVPGVLRGTERGGAADGDGQATDPAPAAEVPPRPVVIEAAFVTTKLLPQLKTNLELTSQHELVRLLHVRRRAEGEHRQARLLPRDVRPLRAYTLVKLEPVVQRPDHRPLVLG